MTGLVRKEWLPVCPVLLQGSVEPLGLAVLPRAVRPRLHVPRAEERQGVLERAGDDVVLRVVGHHGPDRDAVLGEELCCLGEERSAGGALLIGQDLRECEPGVVIDGDVNVVESEIAGSVSVVINDSWAIDPPPATVRDATEFLHVDVDQIAGVVVLVTQLRGPRGANANPGDRVQLMQSRQPCPSDDPRGGRGADREAQRQLVTADPLGLPHREQLTHDRAGRRCW